MKDNKYMQFIFSVVLVWIAFFIIFMIIDHYFKAQLVQFSTTKMVKLQINSRCVFGVQKAMILGR